MTRTGNEKYHTTMWNGPRPPEPEAPNYDHLMRGHYNGRADHENTSTLLSKMYGP